MFYPDKHKHENVFDEPDRDRMHKEMAKLRNHVFSDFGEAAAAVRGCLRECSAHPFQKREENCSAVFSEAGGSCARRHPSATMRPSGRTTAP